MVFVWELKIPQSILVHDLLTIEIKILFLKTDHYIEPKFQNQLNDGPGWKVGFSFPIQTPYRNFCNYWVLKMSDFAKQTCTSKLTLD